MSATEADAQVSISARLDQLQSGLQVAVNDARGAAQQMAQHLAGIRPAAEEAGKSLHGGGLEESIKSLKSEMVAGDRTINFFARSLNGIVPEASAAGQGVRLLADGLIGGVGLGFAIQAVMAGIQLFTDAMKENAKAAEEARKANEKLDDLLGKSAMARARAEYVAAGGDSGRFDALAGRMERESAIQDLRNNLLAKLAEQQQTLGKYTAEGLASIDSDSMQFKEYTAARQEEAAILAQIVRADSALSNVRIADATTVGTDAAKKAAEEAKKAGEEAKKAADAALKLAVEVAAARIKAEQAWNRATGFQDATGIFAKPDTSKLFGTEVTPRFDLLDKSNEAWNKGFEKQEIADAAEEKKRKDAARKAGEEIGKAYVQPMVSTFTQGLAQMMQGQLKFRDFMKSLWSQILNTVVQSFTKLIVDTIVNKLVETVVQKTAAIAEINAYAGVAGAGAAAAMAGIPIVGPGLAVKAMTETSGAVLASMMPLASAAGGWELPSFGGPFPAILHPDEKVLPARTSRRFDAAFDLMERGGAGSAAPPTIQISAMDASSFERWLQKGGADVIQREFRKRARDGRS